MNWLSHYFLPCSATSKRPPGESGPHNAEPNRPSPDGHCDNGEIRRGAGANVARASRN